MLSSLNHIAVSDGTRDHSRVASALSVLLGSVFISLTAQIAIPIGPVPVSAQTLGVLLVGALLGPRHGPLAVILYLAKGAAGLPVFAGARAGFAVLAGPTGGYLIGFAVAAAIVGWLCTVVSTRRPGFVFLIMIAGSAVIYLFGTLWLSRFVGWSRVFAVGVAPFLFGDAVKAGIATVALPLIPGRWYIYRT